MSAEAQWTLSARELAEIVGGRVRGGSEGISAIWTDTRKPVPPRAVFFALAGPNCDGHRYVEAALAAGALAVVVSAGSAVELLPGRAEIVVADTLEALQALAAWHRRRFLGTVVGITGSNGKTTVKEMLRCALSRSRRVWASPLSWNSQLGVALALLQLDLSADVALLECGISRPGEMARLAEMTAPDIGVFVNVGHAHHATLGTLAEVAFEKSQLFGPAMTVVVPAADFPARAALRDRSAHVLATRIREVDGAAGRGRQLVAEFGGHAVALPQTVELLNSAAAMQTNAALAAAAATMLGVTQEDVINGLSAWRPVPMRLEISTTPRGVHLINDAWTADPESLKMAVEVLRHEAVSGRTFVVLGDFAEQGEHSRQVYRDVARTIVAVGVDYLVSVGEGGRLIAEACAADESSKVQIHSVDTAVDAARFVEERARPGDYVLLKASRPVRLEEAAEILLEAVSPSRVHVDLDAIEHNTGTIRAAAGEGMALMAVVKAFGYGLDAYRVARAAIAGGATYLAVAYPDEGLHLRRRGVDVPILVQNVLPHEAAKVAAGQLSAVVVSGAQVATLEAAAGAAGYAMPVHLKVDTGMGRAGVSIEDGLDMAQRIAASPLLRFEGLMTHLAAADDPAQDGFTREQLRAFAALRERCAAAGLEPRWVHAANSAGALRFPTAGTNMVRSGIGLLGYADLPEAKLLPCLELVTRVVSTRQIRAGDPVGYGLSWRATEDTTIAVVAIGYNDGYPRALSNLGEMVIHGETVPVVGRVCMDVTMVDVGRVGRPVRAGDEVVVYGSRPEGPSLIEMATRADTIPYELLTRISPRVRRIYRTAG